jgi:3'(2'), 5'-bisphosphate nucleotidase
MSYANLADYGRDLATIVEAAAEVILPFWRTELDVVRKADESPVTEADRAGERLILARLAERFPEIPAISEEHASEFGAPVAGAICAPATGEVWFTSADGVLKREGPGAAETRVQVRVWPEGQALALISHTMKEERATELAAQYGFSLRAPMDSSIKLVRIAEGAADIYPRHGPTMEWDTAAGHAILIAAGGRLTTPEGEAFTYGKADQGFRNGWFVARGA